MTTGLTNLPRVIALGRVMSFTMLLSAGGCDRPPASPTATTLALMESVAVAPKPEPPVSVAAKLLPAQRELLQELGWLDYVDGNIDIVRYYDYQSFESEDGPAVGLSMYWDGVRIADIATTGRSDLEVAATLVHEAAHLSGIYEIGDLLDEDAADAIETRFLRQLAALRSDDSHQRESQEGLQWQIP